MRIHKQFFKNIALLTLLSTGFAVGSIAQDTSTIINPETNTPTILTTTPGGGEMNVDPGIAIQITFSIDMYEASINGATLLLHAANVDSIPNNYSEVMFDEQIRDQSDRSVIKDSKNSRQQTMSAVSGTISYSNKVAVFTPNEKLSEGTMYTFTVTSGVQSLDYIAIETDHSWSFSTVNTPGSNSLKKQKQSGSYGMKLTDDKPIFITSTTESKIIDLGKANHYVILVKNYINNQSGSNITGHVGEGSSVSKTNSSKVAVQSTEDKNSDMQLSKTDTAHVAEALKDMVSAFTDATKLNGNDLTSHENEDFHSIALTAGVHEWSESLRISSNIALSGSANDMWLFKVSKDLIVDENTMFTLTNGARAENVFWYVEGEVSVGGNASFEGIILSMNEITFDKGAKMNGRMFSQTSITLDDNTITEPKNMEGQASSSNK